MKTLYLRPYFLGCHLDYLPGAIFERRGSHPVSNWSCIHSQNIRQAIHNNYIIIKEKNPSNYLGDDDGKDEIFVNGRDVGFESGHARKDDEADAEEEERDSDADVDDRGLGKGVGLLELFVGNVKNGGEGRQMIAFASHVPLSARLGS